MTASIAQASALAHLQAWYRTPLGQEVARLECACAQRMLSTTFGYYLAQIGATETFQDALLASRIRHRILLPCEPHSLAGGAQIIAREDRLPLAADSIDAILLPHTLDFTPSPRAVLGEVERVLIPEGRVIIIGFNALSSWGLRRLLWARREMPWCGRFRTASQVEDWLGALGCEIERRETLMFCPPLTRMQGTRCGLLDRVGRRLWPAMGGIYVIRAVKRVAILTPLKPVRSKHRAILAGSAVRPTTRGTGHA